MRDKEKAVRMLDRIGVLEELRGEIGLSRWTI